MTETLRVVRVEGSPGGCGAPEQVTAEIMGATPHPQIVRVEFIAPLGTYRCGDTVAVTVLNGAAS